MSNEIYILTGCRAVYLEVDIIFNSNSLCLYLDLDMISSFRYYIKKETF